MSKFLLRQFIGLTPQREKNTAEKEFSRLGITYRQIAPIKLVDLGLNRRANSMLPLTWRELLMITYKP